MKRWLVAGGVVLALFAGLVAAGALLPESPERLTGSVTNARPDGVRALAQVLGANGVTVSQVTALDDATVAPAGSTLAVYLSTGLSEEALDRLAATPAALVVVYTGQADLADIDRLTGDRVTTQYWWTDDDQVAAGCTDPDAIAAGTLTPESQWGLVALSDTVTSCFGNDEGAALYADTVTQRHRVTVIAGSRWLRNDTITEEGNAALALRVFGRHPGLTWYLPGRDAMPAASPTDDGQFEGFSLLPPWARTVFALLLVAAAAAALWRGRRFGALLRENLPVEVPASEVSSGLARLYRQSGARGHAAAALRATTIQRVGGRVGLPASAPPDLVIQRLAEAGGDHPEHVRALLYGPAPDTDTGLAGLANALSDLERKLRRD